MLNTKSQYNYSETVDYIKSLSSSICSILSSNHSNVFIHCNFYGGSFVFYFLHEGKKTYTVSPSLFSSGSYTISENNNTKKFELLRINVSKQLFSVKIRIDSPRGTTKDVEDVYKFLVIKKMNS